MPSINMRRRVRAVEKYGLTMGGGLRGSAQTSFAVSRSLNFWILPVEVLGSSANTT
jgi:hypothetical protein